MELVIRGCERLAFGLLAAACALRGYRGDPNDAHALAHAAVAQAAMDSDNCDGSSCGRADLVLEALERRKRVN